MIKPDEIDGLEPLASVGSRDERWRALGNRTLEQHHALIAQYSLHEGVPLGVRQHYENARNAWLYPKSGSYPVAGSASGGLNGLSTGAILSLT